jgi:hypothetical protein
MFPSSSVTRVRHEFNQPFSEYAEMPSRFGFVGMQILQPILVNEQAGEYEVESIETELQDGELTRASNGTYNRISDQFTEVAYKTRELGLESRLDDRTLNRFSSLANAEGSAVRRLQMRIQRGIESSLISKVTDTGTIPNAGVAVSWKTHATSTPAVDVANALKEIYENSGLIGDTVVMSYTKMLDFLQSASVKTSLVFTGRGAGAAARDLWDNLDQIAAFLGVKRVLIAGAVKNTANNGLPAVLASRWPVGTVGIYVTCPAGSEINQPCLGRTATWGGDGAAIGTGDEPNLVVESYRDEPARSEVFRSRGEVDLTSALVLPEAGYLKTGADA